MNKYFILAALQGVTEFIPVSSSGHLVLAQIFFGMEEPMLSFDVMLHAATACAAAIFLRRELGMILRDCRNLPAVMKKNKQWTAVWRELPYLRFGVFVSAAIIPAVIAGILFKRAIENMFLSLSAAGIGFLVTGTVLFLTKGVSGGRNIGTLCLRDALIIGTAQAAAMVPGISRSGMTIASGMFRGLEKSIAARFSFMLSIPTILGAAVYGLKDGPMILPMSTAELVLSFLIAFIAGYGALALLARIIARAKFHYFSYYCWLMGIISLAAGIVWKRGVP